jgi:hypothetical protein
MIDLSNRSIEDTIYRIEKSEILKNTEAFERVDLVETLTESIRLKVDKIGDYEVPVISNLEVIPADNFVLVGDIKFIPENIKVTGSEKVLMDLPGFPTENKIYTQKTGSFTEKIRLKDTLPGIVEPIEREIKFTADIQQIAEVTFNDLEIIIRGGTLPKNHVISPDKISVTLRGGINEISSLRKDKIAASINISRLLGDSTGILIPKIEIPVNVELVRRSPGYVYHTIISERNYITTK